VFKYEIKMGKNAWVNRGAKLAGKEDVVVSKKYFTQYSLVILIVESYR